jgi:flagellar assembly protein FliH
LTIRRHGGSAAAAPSGPRIADGPGLSVRRRPLEPASPIDYTSLSPGAPVAGVTADRGHAAGYEAGYADGQRDAEAAARDAERDSLARVDRALTALSRSVEAARSAYEERAAQLEGAVPPFAFELLETLFGRESVLAVDPGRQAVARALALDESTLPALVRLCPDDAATIGDLADLAPSRTVTVVADPAVEPGGALVEVGSTTIDSQLSRALDRVRAVIMGRSGEGAR